MPTGSCGPADGEWSEFVAVEERGRRVQVVQRGRVEQLAVLDVRELVGDRVHDPLGRVGPGEAAEDPREALDLGSAPTLERGELVPVDRGADDRERHEEPDDDQLQADAPDEQLLDDREREDEEGPGRPAGIRRARHGSTSTSGVTRRTRRSAGRFPGAPARGRFREFYQCDVDAIGSTSPVVEVEQLSAVSEVMTTLGFQDFVIDLNHRLILRALLANAGVPRERHAEALVALDTLVIDPELVHETAGILFKQREDVAALTPLVPQLLAPESD